MASWSWSRAKKLCQPGGGVSEFRAEGLNHRLYTKIYEGLLWLRSTRYPNVLYTHLPDRNRSCCGASLRAFHFFFCHAGRGTTSRCSSIGGSRFFFLFGGAKAEKCRLQFAIVRGQGVHCRLPQTDAVLVISGFVGFVGRSSVSCHCP